jgi:hypothetical protein
VSNLTPDQWAKLGPIYVTQQQAEAAAAEGRALRVFPDGMEALADFSLPGVGNIPKKASASMMGRRMSSVGTYPTSGLVDMDANPKLTPEDWRGYQTEIGIVDQMRQEDPVVKAITLAWCLPIIRSHWKIEPGGDDRRALEEAEFIRANLFEYVKGGFYEFVEQAVSAVWRGFSLFEIVARFDRDSKQVRLDQLSPMLPRTVYQWSRYPDGQWGVTQSSYIGDPELGQLTPMADMGASFPPEKLLHFVWDPDGDSPEGTSILRPCYGGWKARRLYLKLEATGYERGAFGIPYVEVAPNARAGDSATVNEILRELRTGARAWASLPPGYKLQFADFPMKGADIREARLSAGQDMARAALAPFLFTGEKAGAYSLIQGQQDFFTMALQSAADMIGKVMSHGSSSIIQRLCGWNYDRSEGFPKLTPGSISIGDPKQLVDAIKAAAESGALLPDRGVEEAVRAALGLPELESREEMEHRLRNEQAPTVRTEDAKAADSALNGAQVSSALSIVQSAAMGEITRESAIGMIANFFNLPREVAEEILGGEPSKKTPPPTEVIDVDEHKTVTDDRAPKAAPKVSEVTDDQADKIEEEGDSMEKLAELPGRRAVNGRELRDFEKVVRMDETLAPMQGVKEAMAQAAQDWREAMAPKYAARLARAGDLLKMRAVDVPDLGKLGEAFRIELRRAYRAGQSSVREEIDRMAAQPELARAIKDSDFETTRDGIEVESPEEVAVLSQCSFSWTGQELTGLRYILSLGNDSRVLLAPPKAKKVKAKEPDAPGESVADEIDPEDAVENIARNSALNAGDRAKKDAMTAIQSASIGGELSAEAIEANVIDTIRRLSPGPDLVQAQRDTNTIFGLGRLQEARAEGSEEGIRSAMLESTTCDVCLSKDGTRFPMEELDEYATPDPDCAGGDQCNCICIFVPKEGA